MDAWTTDALLAVHNILESDNNEGVTGKWVVLDRMWCKHLNHDQSELNAGWTFHTRGLNSALGQDPDSNSNLICICDHLVLVLMMHLRVTTLWWPNVVSVCSSCYIRAIQNVYENKTDFHQIGFQKVYRWTNGWRTKMIKAPMSVHPIPEYNTLSDRAIHLYMKIARMHLHVTLISFAVFAWIFIFLKFRNFMGLTKQLWCVILT